MERIEPKYQNLINPFMDEAFLFANFCEIPLYYNLFSLKKKQDYQLYQRLHQEKIHETIKYIENYIINDNYNSEYLLFLYAYICHLLFENYLYSYTNSLVKPLLPIKLTEKQNRKKHGKFLNSIEALIYSERTDQSINRFKITKSFNLNLTEGIEKLISNIFSNVYFFSLGKSVYEISLKRFKKDQRIFANDSLGIKKLFLKACDLLVPLKEYPVSSLSHFKISYKAFDYLNEKKQKWYLYGVIEKDSTYHEMYEEILNKTVQVLNAISDEIYYNKNAKSIIKKILNIKENYF